MMNKDINVKLVNHYSLNLFNHHEILIASTPPINGLFILNSVHDRALESQEYSDIDNTSCLWPLKVTGHALRHDVEKQMLWHRHIAHVGLNSLDNVVMNTYIPKMTAMWDCTCCIKCKLVTQPCTWSTFCETDPLQIVHQDRCCPMPTAMGGGRYMLCCIDDATRYTDEYILQYKLEAMEKFNQWKDHREKESGKQVKRFRTD